MENAVSVHAIQAGHLTLPEKQFLAPLDNINSRKTVPSLSFLIQHRSRFTGKTTRLLFDLGIRRDPQLYHEPIRRHTLTRTPLSGHPDPIDTLTLGNISGSDIDMVIFSHVHWDHVGMPSDFPSSSFIVGHGSLSLLNGTNCVANGDHSHFEIDLLPMERTIELSDPMESVHCRDVRSAQCRESQSEISFHRPWRPFHSLPNTLDIFGDGSVLVVDSPGHLPGHINLLCRVDVGPTRYVYLAGDACHDRRILTGECTIAEWKDPNFSNKTCCIHFDRKQALETIKMIRLLELGNTSLRPVEVILAHDYEWAKDAERRGRFFPGKL